MLSFVADPITDGMLIPWAAGNMRGTIWAVAHESRDTFDLADYELLNTLADLVSVVVEHQTNERALRNKVRDQARAILANELAHKINNPLQTLTNTMFLVEQGGADVQDHVQQAAMELRALSELVRELLKTQPPPKSISNRSHLSPA